MPKITTTENGYILETNFRFAANVFLLFDKNGDFVEKSDDYNVLHAKLITMAKLQEPEASSAFVLLQRRNVYFKLINQTLIFTSHS